MIMVTGATGHLGNVLVRELVGAGKKVRALVLPREDRGALAGVDLEWSEGDILNPGSLNDAMHGVEDVYHLAALVSISPGQEELLWEVNVNGTRNVLAACRHAGVRRVIFTSSIHALARPPQGVTIDESLPFDAENPAGAYDRTKAQASLEVQAAARNGQDAVIVCPTGVIGPFDFRRSEMGELILGWMKKKIGVITTGAFDFTDVRDVARGHLLAAERGRSGETYILGGERISLEQVYRLVKDCTRTYAPLVRLPTPLALVGARLAEWYYQVSRTRPKFTRYAIETVCSNSHISSDKARHELGYLPRSLTKTIHDTVAWWQANETRTRASLRAG